MSKDSTHPWVLCYCQGYELRDELFSLLTCSRQALDEHVGRIIRQNKKASFIFLFIPLVFVVELSWLLILVPVLVKSLVNRFIPFSTIPPHCVWYCITHRCRGWFWHFWRVRVEQSCSFTCNFSGWLFHCSFSGVDIDLKKSSCNPCNMTNSSIH